MTGPVSRIRHDLLSELTRGADLPLAPISEDKLIILAECLCQAFNDIRKSHAYVVGNGSETEVSILMQARLNTLHQDNRLWAHLVSHVGRGNEYCSYDGSHIEKRPDLSIILTNLDRRFPLVVEAKILNVADSKSVSLYCNKGIKRFVQGEYAWGNQEAFMIGYVRDGSTIGMTLIPFLLEHSNRLSLNHLVQNQTILPISSTCDIEKTIHERKFTYGNRQPPHEPGPITLWHLWLSV